MKCPMGLGNKFLGQPTSSFVNKSAVRHWFQNDSLKNQSVENIHLFKNQSINQLTIE